ncbi:GH92 family glycosyl hydrolase [Agrococcus casei]|uniref:GH92 family glycosyl hydrolase n=1 Tax=Agrococcus casei TaxID=343512 RepID=UPI003F8F3099
MTQQRKAQVRTTRRIRGPLGVIVAAVAAFSMLAPLPANAEPLNSSFHSSFEADDSAPVLEPTGEAVNVSGDQFAPGSALGHVAAVTTSGENPPNEVAANLADGMAGSKWLVFESTGWVEYEFDEAQPIVRYTLTSANDAEERDPSSFRVLGSQDGEEWTLLDSRSGETFDDRAATNVYEVEATGETYKHLRLEVTENQSGSIVQLAGWEPIAVADAVAEPAPLTAEVSTGPTMSYTAKTNVGFTGVQSLKYSGHHLDTGAAASSTLLYSDVDVAIEADSELSYKLFPQLDSGQSYASTFAAVDLILDDGTKLSETDAVDAYGYGANAVDQGLSNALFPDQWNSVTIDLSAFAGRTVTDIVLSYEHPGEGVNAVELPDADTVVAGWLDDVVIGAAEQRDTSDGLVSYVDTRRGTNSTGGFSRGNNLPAAAWPNGFNFVTPMTDADNVGTLYHYQQSNTAQNRPALEGIGISHEPSIWMGDRNQLAVLPAANADPTSSLDDRKLTFSHDNETARPDIYQVEFDNGITAEVTATDHGVIYRFSFVDDASSVLVDQLVDDSKLSVDGSVVSGWVDGGSGWPGRTRMFVYGEFDSQPIAAGATNNGDRNDSARYAAFDTSSDKTVELRIATSFISQDQAAANYGFELDGVSFDQAHTAVQDAWNDRLGVITDVQGASDAELVNLYSGLYRLNLYPNSQFENVGTADAPEYAYASPVSPTEGEATDTETNAPIVEGKIYVNNGFWDTYRTAWPLYSLLYPDVAEELVDGFVQQYRDGGWIARWSSPGYADLMTGTSSDVAFAEAYLAGALSNATALEAYDAAVKNATVLPESNAVGRKGLAESIFLGFTESDTHESASWGLEGFINDFGIANMATALAEDPETPADQVDRLLEEADYFTARASHYVEMYNEEAGTFTARNRDGSWPEGAEFDKKAWGGAFTEASAWTFAFHAPHDVDGLAALYGGREGLLAEFDEFLTTREDASYSGIHEAREARDVRLGMLGMSNQISHHIPYVLAEAGDPARAQALISDIQQRLFVGSDIGQGYPGDEDNGEFSAWYVFSALGFYPLEVGSGDYTIGSPLFDSATVHLAGGDLTIQAPGASDGLDYVAGVNVNGQDISTTTFDGDLLREGGTMTFAMSDEPSDWGAKDLGEELEVPETMVDATDPELGALAAADGTPVDSLVDDTMLSSTTFDSGSAELTWTTASVPVRLGQYTLTSTDPETAPVSWTLEGSVDGEVWVELDAREDQEFVWDTQTRPFGIDDDGAFTSFRLQVDAADGSALQLAELELFAAPADAGDLSVTAAAQQSVEVDELFDGTLATVVGSEADASGYEVTVDYGDGTDAQTAELTRDALGGWKVTAEHTFTAPGLYTAAITARDSAGAVATAQASVRVTRDATFEGALNNVCIGDLGATAADCDGLGYGYDRAKLLDEGFVQGETVAIEGTELTYDLPGVEPGEPDNLTGEGQTVSIDLGDGATQLAFVGTANETPREPEAVLHFTDGSEQIVKISFGDWVGSVSSPAFDNTVVAISEGRLRGTAAESGTPKNTAIYATAAIDLDVDEQGAPKVVESLTMPDEPGSLRDGRVHVFAIASDGARESTPLVVEPAEVAVQTAGEEFESTLATVSGGADAQTATVNWGDGSDVVATDVSDGQVSASHTYAAEGDYAVTVTVDDGMKSAEAELQITVEAAAVEYEPEIAVSPEAVRPGDSVDVTGSGFAPDEQVAVQLGNEEAVTVQSDSDGAVAASLDVPDDMVDGTVPVTAVGEVSMTEARAEVRVQADLPQPVETAVTLAAQPEDLAAGDLLTLTAKVTPEDAVGQIEFREGDELVATAMVSGGVGEAEIPVETSGEHTYVAHFIPEDDAAFGASVSDPVTVTVRDTPVLEAELTISQSEVVQGGTVEAVGRGFGSAETVSIALHSDPMHLTEVTADDNGAFRIQLTIPADAPVGDHTIVAEGADSGLQAEAPITVTDAATTDPNDDLPETGGTVSALLILLVLALVGAGLVLTMRMRRAE